MLQEIRNKDQTIAVIIRCKYQNEGITFFTPEDFSQQLAYMKRSKNYQIDPHIHHKVNRNVQLTQEVLFIKKGKVKVDFYTDDKVFFQSEILTDGDVILLAAGGHGLTMLDETEMIEVKQGPYAGNGDKERFTPVS